LPKIEKDVKTLSDGLSYSFNNFRRIWNFYWVLIPIFGWLAFAGYSVKIIKSLLNKEFHELPAFGSFWENFRVGFFFFLYSLVISLVIMVITALPFIGWIFSIYFILISPLLTINYAKNTKFVDGFDFAKVTRGIFNKNFGEYFIAYVKSIVVGVLFLLASILIITMVLTIPAISFVKYYYFVDYYNKYLE
jgi:hypothetical protein